MDIDNDGPHGGTGAWTVKDAKPGLLSSWLKYTETMCVETRKGKQRPKCHRSTNSYVLFYGSFLLGLGWPHTGLPKFHVFIFHRMWYGS